MAQSKYVTVSTEEAEIELTRFMSGDAEVWRAAITCPGLGCLSDNTEKLQDRGCQGRTRPCSRSPCGHRERWDRQARDQGGFLVAGHQGCGWSSLGPWERRAGTEDTDRNLVSAAPWSCCPGHHLQDRLPLGHQVGLQVPLKVWVCVCGGEG